ncbi:MAG: glycosyltransferase family 4 protein, partial [Patescibacteria group bacterium]
TRPGEEHFRDDLTGRVFRYAENASRVALTFPHDVIHAHDWLSFGAGISAKRASRAPLVVHVHATEFDRTGGHSEHPTIAAVEADGLSNADSIIAVSQYTKNIVCERYNIDDEKVSVVHNGYDSSEIAFTTNQSFDWLKKIGFKIVLFVGRITLQKGPEYFIRAAVRTLEHYPKVIFLVAGSGDMEPAMIREAARAGISERVLFSGFVRGEELASLYKSADLYVMPSVSEPFGITALEAAAAGVPVIISKQSGVSEVLKHAIAVDFWDTEELAAKIIAVLTHAPLANVIRRNTFVEAISSTWRKAASSISRLYRKLISRKS